MVLSALCLRVLSSRMMPRESEWPRLGNDPASQQPRIFPIHRQLYRCFTRITGGRVNVLAQCVQGYDVPLVADIHFQPKIAMEVAEAFEKIRINPGNFVDGRKTFDEYVYDSKVSRSP